MERVAGIEPASSAWKAEVLPLNHTRYILLLEGIPIRSTPPKSSGLDPPFPTFHSAQSKSQRSTSMVEGGGFEPPKLARQIYSLIPLATREPLQKEALDSAFESSACQI